MFILPSSNKHKAMTLLFSLLPLCQVKGDQVNLVNFPINQVYYLRTTITE
jgi:hypothetical protein